MCNQRILVVASLFTILQNFSEMREGHDGQGGTLKKRGISAVMVNIPPLDDQE